MTEISNNPVNIGGRYLVRTQTSGVSIGTVRSASFGPTMVVVLDDSIRIHSWSGAFTCSEIAANGCKAHAAHNPAGFVVADTGVEMIPVSDSVWAFILGAAHFGSK